MTVADAKTILVPWGEHVGMTLYALLQEYPGYFVWIATEANIRGEFRHAVHVLMNEPKVMAWARARAKRNIQDTNTMRIWADR